MILAVFATLTTLVPQDTATAALDRSLLGTWTGALEARVLEVDQFRFAIWERDGELTGGVRVGEGTGLLDARPGETPGDFVIAVASSDVDGRVEVSLDGDEGTGRMLFPDAGIDTGFTLKRTSVEVAGDLRLEVDASVERPVQVDRAGLPDFLESEIQPVVTRFLDDEGVVGLSLATILDHEVVDIRSFGWEDFQARIPATVKTRYRWASISKPVTAVAALQLASEGTLDLERDVRTYVPEFPEKASVVTALDLLSHQAGIVHYQHRPVPTPARYDDPNPFRSRILALDMFKDAPLVFEPGTDYSYSTHGYALLGAVVERAGKERYSKLVDQRIAKPLGMETFRPDFHQSEEIPHQTRGYARIADGRTLDTGDSNVAWKLAGGGFLSNVEDLAKFGVGLLGDDLLDEDWRLRMFTPRATSSGRASGYGLGMSSFTVDGQRTTGHGGAQRKTRTHLRIVPDLGIGVAIMCNTEGADVEALAISVLEILID